MEPIDIFIRYSDYNVKLENVATLSQADHLIYNDEGDGFKAHIKTSLKFALLTVGSPLISLVRAVRSAVFLFSGECDRAGREFIGALATPLLASASLVGSLLSSLVYVISAGDTSFYISLRRTYAYFEAWVGKIHLDANDLPSYSQRVSEPMDFSSRIWTTAPCMQPLLENGFSKQGGLLDAKRLQKIFPFIKINDVHLEQDYYNYNSVVIQSEYASEHVHYTACNGACEHRKITSTCCCCYRIESVYDRVLCCEVGKGTCTSIANSGDSCGIVSASCCGVGTCCCYVKEDHVLTELNAGCFGPEALCCATTCIRKESLA